MRCQAGGHWPSRSRTRQCLLILLLFFALCVLIRSQPIVEDGTEEDASYYADNEVDLGVDPEAEMVEEDNGPSIEIEEEEQPTTEVELDEDGNVIVKPEPYYDDDGNLVYPEEPKPNPEEALHHDDYIIDEVQTEDDVRARLILDEITEYYDEEGLTWYKVQLHVQNIGEVDICGVTIEISNKSHVEEAWTLTPIPETENLYDLLWCYNVSFAQTRFFGLITQGKEVPDVSLYSLLSCNATEAAEVVDEDAESEEDPNAPVSEDGGGADEPAADGEEEYVDAEGRRRRRRKTRRKRRLQNVEEVTLEIDEMAEHVELAIDEVQEIGGSGGPPGTRQVLVNAHVTNMASMPICDISIWVYNFNRATKYWSITADKDEEGKIKSEVVRLPSVHSQLDASQSHFFGFVMQMDAEFPNMAVVTAGHCGSRSESPQ